MTERTAGSKTSAVEISVIRRDSPGKNSKIYLMLENKKPIVLGTGRFAVVWLASEGDDVVNSHLLAVKLVRSDPKSRAVNAAGRWRFFEEMLKTSIHGSGQGLVEYVGYGSFLASGSWEELESQKFNLDTMSEFEFFEQLNNRPLVDEVRRQNGQAFETISSDIPLQGEFYAMKAAHGTLEDFLVLPHEWKENKLYHREGTRAFVSLAKFRKDKERDANQLSSIGFDNLSNEVENHSGLTLLSKLKDQRVRNRVVMLLASSIAEAVGELHTKTSEGQGYLCHRDLKLGNLLLVGDDLSKLTVTLSDLGFVGGNESLAAGRQTAKLNAREAYVLPPGTFPFRAPEQIQPIYEVGCIISKPATVSPATHRTFCRRFSFALSLM